MAEQEENESVATLGCRLETQMVLLLAKDKVKEDSKDEMLRTRLWSGLKSEKLKEATRHKFDSGIDFNSLLVEIRGTEQELGLTSTSKQAKRSVLSHQSVASSEDTQGKAEVGQSDSMTAEMLKQILSRIEQLESKINQPYHNQQPKPKPRCTNSKPRGNNSANTPQNGHDSESTKLVCFRCGRSDHIKRGCRAEYHINGQPLNGKQPAPGARQ